MATAGRGNAPCYDLDVALPPARIWLPVGMLIAATATCALPGYDFSEGSGTAGAGTGASGGSGGTLVGGGGVGGVAEGGGGSGGAAVCPPPVEQWNPDTCEGDLQFDADNCGACGRSCLGAPCTQGKCEFVPFGVQQFARDIMPLDDERLYVSVLDDPGGIWELGQPSLEPFVGSIQPYGLALHEGTLYFADGRDMGGGGSPVTLGGVYEFDGALTNATQIAAESGTLGLHVDDEGIYFVETWYGGVSVWVFGDAEHRVLYDSGTTQVLSVNGVHGVITTDANYAYFAVEVAHDTMTEGAYRVVKLGSELPNFEPELIYDTSATGWTVTDLLAVDGYLYIAEELRDGNGLCITGSVSRAEITQDGIDQLEVLHAESACPHSFESDAHFVYWLERAAPNTGTIGRYSRFCDSPYEVLREGLDEPRFLRVTEGAMFLGEWLGSGNTRLTRSTKTADPE